ncbi:MAG: energy transducer TonB [Cytophagales bacterium]|nr:MAG: energy transducer TonB [Cytophagales bacterium]
MEEKKNPKVDTNRQKGLFLNIGLVVSLGLSYAAFEYTTKDEVAQKSASNDNSLFEETEEPPPTEQNTPPPQVVLQQPEIVEVPDEEEIEEQINLNAETDEYEAPPEQEKVNAPIVNDVIEEEKQEEIFLVVEDPANFPGGIEKFYKYVQKEMEYPTQARRMGLEGKVTVQFVVDKDGSITDVKVLKGIGGGCDEEAIRVIKASPKWNPGKQRGQNVKVRMSLPISFKLG